jgi:hypothetical protein
LSSNAAGRVLTQALSAFSGLDRHLLLRQAHPERHPNFPGARQPGEERVAVRTKQTTVGPRQLPTVPFPSAQILGPEGDVVMTARVIAIVVPRKAYSLP